MDAKLLEQLSVITAEEQEILDGRSDIDRSIYMQGQGKIINDVSFCPRESSSPSVPIPASSTSRSIPTIMWK